MEKAERDQKLAVNLAILTTVLKPGDLVTHTRCLGMVAEHQFTKWLEHHGHRWLAGRATRETRFYLHEAAYADDISALNVTHVNRVPLEDLVELPT